MPKFQSPEAAEEGGGHRGEGGRQLMPVIGIVSQETVDVTATAGGLTAATAHGFVPASAEGRVQEAPIRYRVDGTAATVDTGRLAEVGDVIELRNRGELTLFSAIRAGEENGRVDFALGVDWRP